MEQALLDLRDAVERKYGYDANQPRVPAGNPHGGRWTDGGGRSGAGRSSDERLVRVAQARVGRSGPGFVTLRTGVRTSATLRQQSELQGLRLRASSLERQIRNLDPSWRPAPSFIETIDGEITATRSEIREAEVYLNHLRRQEVGPGPNARQSIPARGPERNFTENERREVNRMGREDGCHRCGIKDSGTRSGNFIPDHQPPNALRRSSNSQRLFPQCKLCSDKQGGQVRHLKK